MALTTSEVLEKLHEVAEIFVSASERPYQYKEIHGTSKVADKSKAVLDVIDYIRVCAKYVMYDLEMTRKQLKEKK